MEQEFLLKFLEIGAIDLKGDDTKLEKLRSTAKDLSAALRKAPSKTARFTMVAADPNIAATDPTVDQAMAALRKQWETVANAFAGRPVGILRAILLDAIVQAARSDDAIAVAFVNTAHNAWPMPRRPTKLRFGVKQLAKSRRRSMHVLRQSGQRRRWLRSSRCITRCRPQCLRTFRHPPSIRVNSRRKSFPLRGLGGATIRIVITSRTIPRRGRKTFQTG